jgi:sugar phosphate isomerase/epimerase
VLLEETDPQLVSFEIDLYWTVHGGGDPLDYFDRHPGRFSLCHVKDRTADGEMVDVGAGAIDFAAIFARSQQAGLEYFFVEHDEPADPLASIAASHDYLRTLTF